MEKLQVYGVQETVKILQQIEPELLKQTRKDIREIAQPLVSAIEQYIPNQPPLRGMAHNGRTAWKPSNVKITVKTSFANKTFTREQSIASVQVGGKKGTDGTAGLQIADMAGRRNKVRRSGRTRAFTRNGNSDVSYRLNGQGAGLIDYLNSNWSRASRFVWRAAETQIATVQAGVSKSIDKLSEATNIKLSMKE